MTQVSSASRYYDIDSILAEDERVPSVFNFDALHLGYMTSQAGDVGMDLSGVRRSKRGRYGNDDDDDDDDDEDEAIFQSTVLKRESKVDLPLWLSRGLARRELVTIGTPRSYGARFRVSLLADPRAVDLRSRGAYYFRVGARLAPFFADMPGMEELRLDLAQALISRYQDMIDKAQSSPNEDVSALTRPLTELELRLFSAGYFASGAYYNWKRRKAPLLRASYVVSKMMGRDGNASGSGGGSGGSGHGAKRRRLS